MSQGGRTSSDWENYTVKVRANKRGSRPRTKDRPLHADSITGRIITVDRGRYRALVDENTPEERLITAARAKELRRQPVLPGDLVQLVGDTTGAPGSLARLVKIDERSTILRRSADDTDPVERAVVANVDQLVIVVAAAHPEPRTGFIDRALVAAYDAGIEPIVCITKTDLRSPEELLKIYSPLGLQIVTSRALSSQGAAAPHSAGETKERASAELSCEALEEMRVLCQGKVSVFLGPSGVGKSTMVNALTGSSRATGGINAVTGRGRHTSSSALMIAVPDALPGTWIIDTPGIRSFGLAHVRPESMLEAFEDLLPASAQCVKGCDHLSGSQGCALDAWVEQGHAGAHGEQRLLSLRRLIASGMGAASEPDPDDQHSYGEKHLGQ